MGVSFIYPALGHILNSVSVFRIRIILALRYTQPCAAFCIPYPYSVFRIRIPYSVLAGFGPSFVFRIRIPHLRLWGQLRIPYPYPYSAFTALGPAPYSVSVSVFRIPWNRVFT